jgi:hypothetical protein
MGATLHLGVVEQSYGFTPAQKAAGKNYAITTGDVAEILEARYHVMEIFYQLHHQEIIAALEQSYGGAVESILMGAPSAADPSAAATSKIEAMFQVFLDTREMEGLGIPGIPTKAALQGVSHRKKHPYKKRPPRPSFVDTGLYSASFRAWVD